MLYVKLLQRMPFFKLVLQIVLFLAVIGAFFPLHYFSFFKILQYDKLQPVMSDMKTCSPHKNIAYLKIHKAASSTIENIFFRFGFKHGLWFALPRKRRYNFASTVYPFKASMIPKEVVGNFEINIFTLHAKWDNKEVRSVMPPDTIYVASVREPAALFESLYHYAEFETSLRLSLDAYVAQTPIDAPRIISHMGYNQMAWDFGLTKEQVYNESAVRTLIRDIDSTFHLVLVSERLDESLILLRHRLCWALEDVVALKINSRQSKFVKELKPETVSLLARRQFTDLILYDHFKEKLDKLVLEFGEERMAAEVRELKRVRERVEAECRFALSPMQEMKPGLAKPFSGRVNGFSGDTDSEKCKHFVFSESAFVDYFRQRQEKAVREAGAAVL